MIQTIHHTHNFPYTFDFVLERGNTLTRGIRFVPAVDMESKTFLWLFQRGSQPVLALQMSTDSASSRVYTEGDVLYIALKVTQSRALKPSTYQHTLMMKSATDTNYTTLLSGNLRVEQKGLIWNDGTLSPNGGGGAGGTNGNGVLDLESLNLNIDTSGLQALIDSNNNLAGLIASIQ